MVRSGQLDDPLLEFVAQIVARELAREHRPSGSRQPNKETTHMTTAAIYARFSTDKQDRSSIDDQARTCRAWAHANG